MIIIQTMPFTDGSEVIVVRVVSENVTVVSPPADLEAIAIKLNLALSKTVIASDENNNVVICNSGKIVKEN